MGDTPSQSSIDIGGDVGGNVVLGTGNLLTQNIIQPPPAAPLAGSAIPPSAAEHFVPRGKIMDDLRAALRAQTVAAIVGVGGMGGVGKTELAIFLAREFEEERPGAVLWMTVADRPLEDVHNRLARALGVSLPLLPTRNTATSCYWPRSSKRLSNW